MVISQVNGVVACEMMDVFVSTVKSGKSWSSANDASHRKNPSSVADIIDPNCSTR